MKNAFRIFALTSAMVVSLGAGQTGARAQDMEDSVDDFLKGRISTEDQARFRADELRRQGAVQHNARSRKNVAPSKYAAGRKAAAHKKAVAQKKMPQLPPGSLTGTVTNEAKEAVRNATTLLIGGVYLDLQEYRSESAYEPGDFRTRGMYGDAQSPTRHGADLNMGGLYSFKNLRPGVYNLVIEAGRTLAPGGVETLYRPQRIVGVVIKPGKETVLNITMNEGKTLEQVGETKGNVGDGGKSGWLEGTVANPQGEPVFTLRSPINTGVFVTIKKTTGEQASLPSDGLAGGFFSGSNLKPGRYSLSVEAGKRNGNPRLIYRPLLVGEVVVRPGVRTVVNLVVHQGEGLERISTPPVTTQTVRIPK